MYIYNHKEKGRKKMGGKSPSKRRRDAFRRRMWEAKQEAKAELKYVFDTAHFDFETKEIIALTESRLLDVVRGEVLVDPRINYYRIFWCST